MATMIQLLPLGESLLDELLRDPETRLRELVSNGPDIKLFLLPVLQQTREFYQRTNCPPPWHGYLGIESEARQLVGICAFKGKPNEASEVEIAYGTAPGLEGRGHATHMAAALVKLAFQSPAIRRVIAHTLPESNASGRVLQKVGMTKIGEVIDPEDGKVWRWEIGRPDL